MGNSERKHNFFKALKALMCDKSSEIIMVLYNHALVLLKTFKHFVTSIISLP